MPLTPTKKIWMDGKMVNWEDATVHVLTHGLHYGTGAFEGIRCYQTSTGLSIFRLRDHMQRLINSCKVIVMDVPYSLEELSSAAVEVVKENDQPSGCYLRPIVYRGYGDLGVNPLHTPTNVAIAAWPWGAYLGEEAVHRGVRVMVSSWRRSDPNAMPTAAKATGSYLNASLAKIEAVKAGFDEAVMLGPDGKVSECTGENIFIVRNGVVITPPSSEAGALPGVTQNTVVRIARDLGYEVRFDAMVRTDIYLADEAFLTGTAVEVIAIASIDDRDVGEGKPGPITKQIQSTYASAVRGELPQYEAWLTRC
jgi:branched-chain amino acid aminotransferase